MRNQHLFISALILLLAACTSDQPSQSTSVTEPVASTADPVVAVSGIEMNDVTRNLVDGLWYVSNLFERQPTPRYQAQKGSYYNFEANGDYALFNPDGTLFHFGSWSYKPGDGD